VATEESLQDDSFRGSGRELGQEIWVKPKRVVFPIAGKGGVGKTTVLATLAEWYAGLGYRADLLDMDPDNKAEGSLKALFTEAHQMNVALADVGDRNTDVPELRAPDMALRARTYRFRAFSQFTEARSVLLP
jgi:Mrp family chromosome partitioning ATPase